MKILAIETSCDETAIAIADFTRAKSGVRVRVLSHIVSSQVKIHAKFGGVVPNLARREHEKNLVPILMQALREAKNKKQEVRKAGREILDSKFLLLDSILERELELLAQFKKSLASLAAPDIDAIAVTSGPGLAPALWVGINFARGLSHLWNKPLIPVNHMAGHIYSALLQKRGVNKKFQVSGFRFPALALLVSGGHTELVLMRGHGKFKIIGETLDDAVGEAFDKVARILELPYPGGPEISRLAEQGDSKKYPLPSPMINSKNYDFSFSGLKTAALYLVRDLGKLDRKKKQDIAASFQKSAVDVLVKKTIRAADEYKVKTILLGGGVSANHHLQKTLGYAIRRELPDSCFLIPDSRLTGDNALMIAAAAYFCGKKKAPDTVRADANARLGK